VLALDSAMRDPDPYDILGISPGAGEDEVRAAYRRLALRWHPDVNPEPGAAARFGAILHAYEVLSDPASRRAIDAARPGGVGAPSGLSVEADELGDAFDVFFGGRPGA